MSRTQYENTLRDLLALPALQVKDLLPEESLAAGFDDVSSGQSLSSVHLVRYQEAADAALTAAAPSRRFTPIHLNMSGRELRGKKARSFRILEVLAQRRGIGHPFEALARVGDHRRLPARAGFRALSVSRDRLRPPYRRLASASGLQLTLHATAAVWRRFGVA